MYIRDYLETIKKHERVVDLGCGDKPYPRADVYVDFFESDNSQRDGAEFKPPDGKYIHWDLNTYPYPFKDKEFDFVIAGHIAEHLDDPPRFCLEVQRIGKRGYIETPNKLYEEIYGWDFHKWYVYIENNYLVFENILDRTFLGKYIRTLYHEKGDAEFIRVHDSNIRNLITAFYWEKAFPFKVIYNIRQKLSQKKHGTLLATIKGYIWR